jgi:Glycerophosphoryl diester phosphodiesterase family
MKKPVAALAAVLVGGLLTTAPAEADHGDPGEHVAGHRCMLYDRAVSNENTPEAVRELSAMPGAVCEIDITSLSDGTVIAWHDEDWRRVADHSTLPAGIGPRDRVENATWSQVSRIRTKGGEPVARLQDMIDASAQYDVPLMIDIRNRFGGNPRQFVDQAEQVGADVRYYQLISASCGTRQTDRFAALGATVGVKILSNCPLTVAQLQARGFSFTSEVSFRLSDAYLRDANLAGIEIGVLDTLRSTDPATSERLVDRGVTRVLLNDPLQAADWFD